MTHHHVARTTFPQTRRLALGATAALLLTATVATTAARAEPPTIDTVAREAIIMDADTGAILYAKNADERMAPSSMSKLMTIYMVFDKLKKGDLKLTDELPVSTKAWRMQGSKMFVMVNTTVSVQDLIHGVIIQSGNDATVVLAEGLAGSEEAFAEQETQKAKELGLTGSHFMNASGWPDPEHYMTAHDLAILSRHIIKDFPEDYAIFSQKDFTYNKIKQGNRNPLIYDKTGADGLKTGHTEAGGFGLSASVKRGDRRLIMVVNGLTSMQSRADEPRKLIEWGFREFENYKPFRAGETVAEADVWLGDRKTVPLVVDQDVVATMPRRARDNAKITLHYDSPLAAPIAAGTVVGKITISSPDAQTIEVPVKTATAVERLGFMGRMSAALGYLLWGNAG
ncbi:MAG TPA: D-alanyl-D-alanine carboxypeptidase family protein [Alphaproteobacteria bacterium]|jgi:D-alanyl-D-alanine carboxypeptidase (penicillin-binding protein 5/6)